MYNVHTGLVNELVLTLSKQIKFLLPDLGKLFFLFQISFAQKVNENKKVDNQSHSVDKRMHYKISFSLHLGTNKRTFPQKVVVFEFPHLLWLKRSWHKTLLFFFQYFESGVYKCKFTKSASMLF